MEAKNSYIQYLKDAQPGLWHSVVSAANDGLIMVDEDNDAVTATNRLLLTYPGLHEVLSFLHDQWVEQFLDDHGTLATLLQNLPQKKLD
ncbi:MAG: hypothetical protein HQM12_04565 [SAR324 cluster bacterium]|nr:hypothetical protein [SAR324 cluster bacterium]